MEVMSEFRLITEWTGKGYGRKKWWSVLRTNRLLKTGVLSTNIENEGAFDVSREGERGLEKGGKKGEKEFEMERESGKKQR